MKNKIKNLKSEIKRYKQRKFLQYCKFILSPLDNYITLEDKLTLRGYTQTLEKKLEVCDIKNSYELMLIYHIMHDIRFFPMVAVDAMDKKNEEKSFNNTRKKMIDFLNLFNERQKGYLSIIDENELIKQLKTLEYIPPITKKHALIVKRDIYLQMMKTAGVGNDRTNRIIKGIENFNKDRNKLNDNERKIFDDKLNEHDSEIDADFKAVAQRYFYHIFNYKSQHP